MRRAPALLAASRGCKEAGRHERCSDLDDDDGERRFFSGTAARRFLRRAFSAAAIWAARRACWARARACTWARYRRMRSSSSAAARIIAICSSVVRSGAPKTGSEAAGSSSMTASDDGVEMPSGNRSSSDRYELTVPESESDSDSDGRLGHEGKAHALLMPSDVEKEDLRGVMSRSPSLGEGGGGGGGSEDGEGEDSVLLPKLKLNRMVDV